MRLSLLPSEQSLRKRVRTPLAMKAECIQLKSRVTSLENKLADLT